jgi:dipeptidyl-peptidase-4
VTRAPIYAAGVPDDDTFPRQYARTQRLTLGEPRNPVVSPDGRRVAFARSQGGDDPVNCLWVLDLQTGAERLVADPRALLGDDDPDDLPPEEKARRERAREGAGGVVAFATNTDVNVAAFALAGRLFVCGLLSGAARELRVDGPVFDPRPDPTARRVAYVSGQTLRVAELDGTNYEIAGEPDSDVSWGSAEFIAAEEMGRQRGYWWSPDGESIAVCRVDTSPVRRWWIGDPANPDRQPTEVAYPAAGTDNAWVSLHVVRLDTAGLPDSTVEIDWDRQRFGYLADVRWVSPDRLLVTVQSRDQRTLEVLEADPATGDTRRRGHESDVAWVDLVPGVPAELPDGRLLTAGYREGTRRLLADGEEITPADLQVRSVVACRAGTVTFLANPLDDPTVQHVWQWTIGDRPGSPGTLRALTTEPGVHTAATSGSLVVIRRAALGTARSTTTVADGQEIANHAEEPLVTPNVRILRLGQQRLAAAVLLPHGATEDDRLPVLLDPYGGPHAQRVLSANSAYLTSQWFADQGFAVLVIDGRGTPGRGSEWERAVHLDLAGPVLDDQVEGLQLAAAEVPQLDLGRVAIRGWSFGGYLAALAVLRRPDVFHAAVAGAPVTEWRLYDTHYTERYLGDPEQDPAPYDRSSLLVQADQLSRPLLLVHGLADDNVVAAHTLQLSSALLAAGRHHEVLPLSGVSHMTPQAVVAENLLLHQLAFLRSALRLS